ncbi:MULTISPECIES: helix-turn-helix domain-containing protein [Haloferax]|uniref:Bacterio-opsin activator n=2 Tax=Haloferax TaxID=2251 RepID=A0A6G1Z6I5_9EURY|nr:MULTISPECIES: helix-turn-helix domain-containing protein [Haloferax]KAB1185385.1 bacterio-opsin activator [Haloferax sp. CBA1149]MRW82028.1 bacterio-opsin activator [Haloferax marinisediminis]
MSVILEFSIAAEDFGLGEVLMGPPTMHLELERVVPTGGMVMPFVWVTGDDQDLFEQSVRNSPRVKELLLLDSIENSRLYRIEWNEEPTHLIESIAAADATVLEARGNDEWFFRLRFSTHDKLSMFHDDVTGQNIPLTVERTFTLTDEDGHGYRFDLTHEQREALVLALTRGYFATPSEVSLDDLAAELEISRQALSHRIRLGNEKVLRSTLLSSTADSE